MPGNAKICVNMSSKCLYLSEYAAVLIVPNVVDNLSLQAYEGWKSIFETLTIFENNLKSFILRKNKEMKRIKRMKKRESLHFIPLPSLTKFCAPHIYAKKAGNS